MGCSQLMYRIQDEFQVRREREREGGRFGFTRESHMRHGQWILLSEWLWAVHADICFVLFHDISVSFRFMYWHSSFFILLHGNCCEIFCLLSLKNLSSVCHIVQISWNSNDRDIYENSLYSISMVSMRNHWHLLRCCRLGGCLDVDLALLCVLSLIL